MTAMSIAFWRRPRDTPKRTDGTEELTRARMQLERLHKIADEQEKVSAEVRERIETNHIAAALERWITTRRPTQ